MKEAMEQILPLERDLFFQLNGSDSLFLDQMMWTLSGRFVWIPLFLFILVLFFYRRPTREALLVTFFFILVFVLSDQLSSSLFKPLFERLRPTHHPDFRELVDTVNGYRGGRFGFVSGHATNSFALATFLSLFYRYRWVTLVAFFWALLNSYTRIYLGVHFISDIAGGMITGVLIAYMLYRIYHLLAMRLFSSSSSSLTSSVHHQNGGWLAFFLLLYMVLLTIFSPVLATLPH